MITADGGGSNGYRLRLWKAALPGFANTTGLTVQVCHFPPGTSKWNKIEHRMFSFIRLNWRGKPLVSHEVIVNVIGSTRTRTGLTIRAALDTGTYPPLSLVRGQWLISTGTAMWLRMWRVAPPNTTSRKREWP